MARLLDLLNEDEPTDEVETTEVQGELDVSEDTSELETEEVEAVDEEKDFDFGLEDEPEPEKPKYSAQEALVHKLSLKNKKFKEAKTELEAANQRIAELEARTATPQPVVEDQSPQSLGDSYGYPPFPILYENGINTPEQFHSAYAQREVDIRNIEARRSQDSSRTTQFEDVKRNRLTRLGEDADRFFETNKINPDRGSDYIANAAHEIDSATQTDGSFAQLLEAVGEGSAAIGYHLGSKSTKGIAALSKVKSMLKQDPGGLLALSYLKDLQRDLTPKNRTKVADIEPDEALLGGGNSLKASGLQRKYDEETDFTKLRAIQREAKSLGIELKSS